MTDDIPGLRNVAAAVPKREGPADILGDVRRAVDAIMEQHRRNPGPMAGEELTAAEFGDLMRRGPWPRRVAVSPKTAEQWRGDASETSLPPMPGVPVETDEFVPDGVVRIVQASQAAEDAAFRERREWRALRPAGPEGFLRGISGA